MQLHLFLIFLIGTEAQFSRPFLGPSWNFALVKTVYGLDGTYANLTEWTFPIRIFFQYILNRRQIGTDDYGLELETANDCQSSRPELQINCVARMIYFSVQDLWAWKKKGPRTSAKTGEWSTPCQDMARRFHDTFQCLALPGSSVSYIYIIEHVLNLIHLTDTTGQIYTYALDVGWFHDTWYPYNTAAMTFHQTNNGWPTFLSPYPHNETASCLERQQNIGIDPDNITGVEWFVVFFSFYIALASHRKRVPKLKQESGLTVKIES